MDMKKLNSMRWRKMLRSFVFQLLNLSTSQFLILLTLTLMGVIASNSEAISNYASPWSPPVSIDSGPSNAYRTDIAFDKRGNAIAVFEQKKGDFYRVFASRYVNGKGWESAVAIDSESGNSYRAQVAFDEKGNAIAVFKQEINPPAPPFDKGGNKGGFYRIYANYYNNIDTNANAGWQGAVPIDNGTGNVDGQDIVFDNEGNAAAVFEAKDGNEMGIYVNIYNKGWSGAFRIDSGQGNAYFPYPLFDDKGNLYVIYYKEEGSPSTSLRTSLEVYVSRIKKREDEKLRSYEVETNILTSQPLKFSTSDSKKEEWAEKKSEITRGIKAVYNPIFLDEIKKRIYSGNYSYSRWETPSKLDSRFRDAYRPTLLSRGNGELTALFVKWDGEFLSAYMANYRNGKWDKLEEVDAGNGDVEHIRGAINSEGEMAVVWTQWQSECQSVRVSECQSKNLRIHARIYNPDSGWGEPKIIDAGERDGYNPSVAFTKNGEIIAVWCQWEKTNVKSYTNIYRKGEGWSKAERLEHEDGETCGVRVAAGPDGDVIAIFEQERNERREAGGKPTNRIFAVELRDDMVVAGFLSAVPAQAGMPAEKNATIKVAATYTVRRLTDGSKENYYAEFSPDGEKIVFVKKQGRYSNLYIMDADGKNMKQLTSGNAADTSPVWTPDGERIIFASNRIKEGWDIWSVKPDGSDLTRITKWSRNEYSPRPTSDGRNILYISTAGGDHSVWIMDMNGENERRLTSGGTGDWFPAMNPDGRDIVFVSTRLGNGDIWTIDSAEKRYHRLTYTDMPEFSPAWSPDGSKVAYVTNKGGEFDIWIMDRDGKNKRRLTKGLSDKKWGSRFSAIKIMETAGYYHLSWHPDGTKLLFTEFQDAGGNTYISMIDFDKEVLNQIEADSAPVPEWTLIGEKELTAGDWEDFGPSFSPDGGSITFSSNRSGNWDIWRMDGSGENIKQLTDNEVNDIAPVFSPDGKEIAYLKKTEDNKKMRSSEDEKKNVLTSQPLNLSTSDSFDIWVMKSDGSDARQITPPLGSPPYKGGEWGGVISYPAWHPNGKEIAFVVKGKDGHEIWTCNLGDSKVQRLRTPLLYKEGRGEVEIGSTPPILPLQRGGVGNRLPTLYRIGYNPAGDKITFESNASGNIEIWTMKTDGTNLARLTEGDSPHWNPVWSPDGKMIAYTTEKLGEEAGHHNWRNYNIWVANAETREERIITGEEQTDWNPVWSPDGKKIAYVTNRADGFKHFGIWMLYLK